MATYYYVHGNKVENAKYYELYRKNPDETYTYFAKQDFQQTLHAPVNGSVIRGPIGKDGKPAEMDYSLAHGAGQVNGQFFMPMAKLTQDGYRYYVRFTGRMNVDTTTATLNYVDYNGILYLPSQQQVGSITVEDDMDIRSDGIYLKTSLGDVNVYSADIDTDTVQGAYIVDVSIWSAPSEYCRTEPILIESLTDDLTGGYCYGKISYAYFATTVYEIAFYDENLGFLGGAEYDDITSIFNGPKPFLSVSDINKISTQIMDVSNLNAKKFVVFSGAYNQDDKDDSPDVVSIGNIYFPLFDPTYPVKKGDKFVVRAIADGFFFKDSESEPDEVE